MTGRRLGAVLPVATPIVLGPFGGLSSVALTAQVSDLGGLGSYGLYGYAPDRIRETIAALRAATQLPFAVNIWLPTGDEVTPGEVDLERHRAAVEPFFAELGIELPATPDRFLPDVAEQVQAALDARPPVLSFVYGVPDRAVVDAAHARDIRVLGTATTVDEAVALQEGGVDAIVASGAEAAGHRVSFLEAPEQSLVGTLALVPQVADAVDVPVIAAGGIADRRGVAAAFALGAGGVQIGTAFLRTRQSAATDAYRSAIAAARAHDTVLTRAMSGRLARGIPNRATRAIEEGDQIAPFPAQNWLTGRFRTEAARAGAGELLSLWAGQSAPLAVLDDTEAVFAELAAGVPAR